MAQIREVRLVDDLDGSTAAGNVVFALDGKGYEIDLSDDNTARLRAVLDPFVAAARRAAGAPARPPRTGQTTERAHNRAVRDWARDQGIDVAGRGRIPADVLAAYQARR